MRILPIDLDSPAELLAGLHEAYLDAHAEQLGPRDTPPTLSWIFTRGDSSQRIEGFAWVEGDKVVAAYAHAFSTRDNLHLTWLSPFFVRPSHRRAGLGTEMLAHARARAAADGRTLMLTESPVSSPAAAFAAARGWSLWQHEARRTLDLEQADWDALRALAPERVEGYAIELHDGPLPPELLGDLAVVLVGMNDAPHGEDVEPDTFDADLMREREASTIPRGDTCYSAIARRLSDGAPAGYTRIYVDVPSTGWGRQADTTVLAEHRGHGLGMALKVANLERAREREPDLRTIITWNATSNRHMLAINEAMGYELLDEWNTWQLRV
ncbi:MAG: GNAT family N-acetyltransferase [Nonomuraea sp.]|nr:GNAT family N-acetyltransferase [Nonomuraea sp.]